MEELVKMSSKGQLVVPYSIRRRSKLHEGDRFIAVDIREGVIFKKVRIPEVKIRFEKLSKDMALHFKKHHITQKDIDDAVRWARKERTGSGR